VIAPANRKRIDLFKTASSDSSGQFTIRGVPPGIYKVFAWRELERNIFLDQSFMERFETYGAPAHVDEGGHVNVTTTIIPTNGHQ
jgi:hypothetical protein